MKTKILFIIITIMIIAEIGFLAYTNFPTEIALKIMPSNAGVSVPVSIVFVFIFMEGLLAGLALLYGNYLESQFKLKEYKRQLEKTSVQSSSDSSRVGVLESKIQVLEKALKSALEQKND